MSTSSVSVPLRLKVEFDNAVSLLSEASRRCWFVANLDGLCTVADLTKAIGKHALISCSYIVFINCCYSIAEKHVSLVQRNGVEAVLDGFLVPPEEVTV
jgi:hypothetical protein